MAHRIVALVAAFAVAASVAQSAIADDPRFAVIVANGNPNDVLDPAMIADIFLGRTATFPDGRIVEPVDCAGDLDTRDDFLATVVGMNRAQFRAHWSRLIFTGRARPPIQLPECRDMVREVARNPHAIGFADPRIVDGSVRVVRIVR